MNNRHAPRPIPRAATRIGGAAALVLAGSLAGSCGERSEVPGADENEGGEHAAATPTHSPQPGSPGPVDAPINALLGTIDTGSRLTDDEARAVLDSTGLEPRAEPEVAVGDPAPPLNVGGWVRGEPIESLGGGSIVVVEMWATWCLPCIKAIPHLNELSQRYADDGVRVVGVNVLERRYDEAEKPEKLAEFIERHDPRYPIAYDTENTIANTWLFASGRNSLPSTYVIDREGRLAWIGHPGAAGSSARAIVGKWRMQTTLDEVLRRLVEGSWDTGSHAAERERAERLERLLRRAADLIATGRDTDEDRGYRLIEALLATDLADEPVLIDTLAWHIATHPSVTDRRLGVAERLAATAIERATGPAASILDTLARVLSEQGRTDDAIIAQRAAVERAESDDLRRRFATRLDELTAEGGGG